MLRHGDRPCCASWVEHYTREDEHDAAPVAVLAIVKVLYQGGEVAAVLHSCYRFGYQYYRCSNAVLSVLGGLFLKKSAMDTNEINLDEFDKSDISSDWNSSEDEAPTMEVEEEKASLPAQQTQQPMDYAQEIEELEQKYNDTMEDQYVIKLGSEIEDYLIDVKLMVGYWQELLDYLKYQPSFIKEFMNNYNSKFKVENLTAQIINKQAAQIVREIRREKIRKRIKKILRR